MKMALQKLEQLILKSEGLLKSKRDLDTQIIGVNQDYMNIRNEILTELKSTYTNETNKLKQEIEERNTKMMITDNIVKLTDAGNFEEAVATHKEYINKGEKSISTIISLDKTAYDNGAYKTQDDWIATGKDFASIADYYKAFKQIKNVMENGNAEQRKNATELKNNLLSEWKSRWSVTSTRVKYNNNLEATVIQHYSSQDKNKVKEATIEIPIYEGVKIEKVLKDKDKKGLKFMQTLLDTEDTAEMIMETLNYVTGKDIDRMYVYTPDMNSRKQNKERLVLLGDLSLDYFYICCGLNSDSLGCARGGA